MKKNFVYSVVFVVLITVIGCALMQERSADRTTQSIEQSSEGDIYTKSVQPIFNQRCIACHSCLESPCQLNLQSYEGIQRGAIKGSLVYSGNRTEEAPLTRLFYDAHSESDWRVMGFYDVIGSVNKSILLQSVALGFQKRDVPETDVKENQYCASDSKDFAKVAKDVKKFAMPYGMASIATEDMRVLSEWVASGAPGPLPRPTGFPSEIKKAKLAWENFLNQDSLKVKHVARYLYEHLFLADFYLESTPRYFLKLVRSSTQCDQDIKVIATRRPNDSPGVNNWYYCFVKSHGVAVDKNHIPYDLSIAKLNWIKKNFMDINWTPDGELNFDPEISSNPFKSFKSIPEIARYKFLLEDAHYHVSTFIKGPVCNGTAAVNSIQEQFYTFFIAPQSDLMVLSPEYSKQVVDQLKLPGHWGSQVNIKSIPVEYVSFIKTRNQYRIKRAEELKHARPNGLTLNDIWNGDGHNDNALLTIMRHGDSARVVKGAFGDISKTAFVLDYSLFERLVYNLVVNFDVYGNVGHQFLTRIYMDLIRMEAENNFLDFLPISDRLPLKKRWYKGTLASMKVFLFNETHFSMIPDGIKFESDEDTQLSLVRRIIFGHLNGKVRGAADTINWKILSDPGAQSDEEKELARIVSLKGKFAEHFPDLAFLVITENGIPKRSYSIIHNKQMKNIAWIMGEGNRRDPEQDSLMIGKGYHGSYPNEILTVEAIDLPQLVDSVLEIESAGNYKKFFKKYGVDRMDPKLWIIYDFIVDDFIKLEPIYGSYFDLSRYRLDR